MIWSALWGAAEAMGNNSSNGVLDGNGGSVLLYGGAAVLGCCCCYWLDVLGARYRLKVATYYAALLVNAALMTPPSALRPGRVENMLIGAALMKPVSALIGLQWEIRGAAHVLKSTRAFVVAVNHQHALDVLALFRLWPLLRRASAVAKRQLMFAGTFGAAAALAGTTFIDRGKGSQARGALAEAVDAAAKDGVRVIVFPEGTRHHERGRPSLLPFKTGAFSAAVAAGVDILPVVVSHYHFLDASSGRNPVFDSGAAVISILEPIEVSRWASDPAGLAAETRRVMLQELLSISKAN